MVAITQTIIKVKFINLYLKLFNFSRFKEKFFSPHFGFQQFFLVICNRCWLVVTNENCVGFVRMDGAEIMVYEVYNSIVQCIKSANCSVQILKRKHVQQKLMSNELFFLTESE